MGGAKGIRPDVVVLCPCSINAATHHDLFIMDDARIDETVPLKTGAAKGQGHDPGFLRTVSGFTKASVQTAFIQKVYGILTIQLLFTTFIGVLFMYHTPTRRYVIDPAHIGLFYVALILPFIFIIMLFCYQRTYPINL